MKPDWQTDDGSVRLYRADCLEILPTLDGVDAVVTDPPYGNKSKFQGGGWARKSEYIRDGASWDDKPADVSHLIEMNLPTIIWGGNYFRLPPSRGWLVWEKDGAGTTFTLGHGELAWTNLDIPIRFFKHPRHKATGKHRPVHPTAKPLRLMEWCLSFVPDEANSILSTRQKRKRRIERALKNESRAAPRNKPAGLTPPVDVPDSTINPQCAGNSP